MHYKTLNVESAFQEMVEGVYTGRIPTYITTSRNGEVCQVEEPFILTYQHPEERVLLNPYRDANPFFHLYEALWMLAGRNTVTPLKYYNNQIAQYSDDGVTFNGAYGYRWRRAQHFVASSGMYHWSYGDQIELLIEHLREKPYSRRAVLNMWNIQDDLLHIGDSKDVCCNLSVCFSIETGLCPECGGSGEDHVHPVLEYAACNRCHGSPHDQPEFLNMTVFNRSNDMILGMLGANAVHFSILQEYMAAALGLKLGVYNQITNNLHVYTSNWKPDYWLKWYIEKPAEQRLGEQQLYPKIPLVKDKKVFDEELNSFVSRHQWDAMAGEYNEPFFATVAQPMMMAFHHHKNRMYDLARDAIAHVCDGWWAWAGLAWITKRETLYAERRRDKQSNTPG